MDSVKNMGRNKMFKCFNANDVVDDNIRCGSTLPPLSSASDDECARKTTKKKLQRSFSGSVKAAFSRTTLGKKMRSKKHREDSIRSNSVSEASSRNEKYDNIPRMKKNMSNRDFSDSEESLRTSPSRSSVLTPAFTPVVTPSSSITPSTSSSSSTYSNSRCNSLERSRQMMNVPNSQQTLTKRELIKSVYSRNSTSSGGMLSCVICLVSLVLCGKVFAIMACTAMWLYFSPARKSSRSTEAVVVDSEENRKKVILEGLLDRSRSRIL